MRLTLREFEGYLDIKGVTNSFLDCTDADGDGMPDDDPCLPMDERRFGSDPTKKDTDDDGLSDLAEFLAGRYRGSDPNSPDTDADGVKDGKDPYPLVAISSMLRYRYYPGDSRSISLLDDREDREGALERHNKYGRQRLIDSVFVRNDPGYTVHVDCEWDEDGLHFGFYGPKGLAVQVKIDGSAANGFWEGGDTYLLRITEERVEFAGLGLEGEVPGATVKTKFPKPELGVVAAYIPAALGQGVSKEINYGGKREPETSWTG